MVGVYRSYASFLLLLFGLTSLLVGLGFKIAAVPFHMWTPDVYDGAPSYVTGFMATAVKAAGVAILLRFALLMQPQLAFAWQRSRSEGRPTPNLFSKGSRAAPCGPVPPWSARSWRAAFARRYCQVLTARPTTRARKVRTKTNPNR